MPFNYTITEVSKSFVQVKFDDDRQIKIPIRTWHHKDFVEAHIRNAYNEEDKGNIEDIPFKVGDTGTLKTQQDMEEEIKNSSNNLNQKVLPPQAMRDACYPHIKDVQLALIKAVLKNEKTDLEAIQAKFDEVNAKYPLDDTKYSSSELNKELGGRRYFGF
tara:strand:- start:72 stop:551 length:480 start_codon:yes stop_codon:yes gene_type:complete